MRKITLLALLMPLWACASSGPPRPAAEAVLPRGVEVSEVCGDGDPTPRLRALVVDPAGEPLPGAVIDVVEGSRQVTQGTAGRDGSVLFALHARPYTLSVELPGFAAPPPFPVRAKTECEVQVSIQASPRR